jgi:predicted ATPase/class 3 adenylate cyclase
VALPTGTVTFCMTDIEGSTRLLAELGNEYAAVLLAHRGIVRGELDRHRGIEVETEGDSFFCVFPSASDAVRAAVEVQRSLAGHAWPGGRQIRMRIGLHTGEGVLGDGGYVGMDVHRVARVCAAGHGGQVLLTAATWALVEGHWPDGVGAVPLGAHRLKDLPAPETLYQLVADGLSSSFPPVRSLDAPVYELPAVPAPIFGRDDDAARVAELLAGHRLVTLTGPGGVGKTRLALHLGRLLRPDFPDGVAFVSLAEASDSDCGCDLVPEEIARTLALPPASYGGEGLTRLAGHLHDRRMLLILDNLEQFDHGAQVIEKLLRAAPGPRVLATSRRPLRLRGEQQYPLEPLTREAAVAQFTERAHTVRPGLRLGEQELAAVERIVDGVDGLPLAVELAAARVGTLSPKQIADRLGSQLRLLVSGPRDLPGRQQTVRSTLQWSYDLLDDQARRVFAALAVFPGGATIEALEQVVPGEAGELDLPVEALLDQGLLRRGPDGSDRFVTLKVVREFAAEMLAHGDIADVWHRETVRLADLVEETAPLLTTAEPAGALDRLGAEHDNLRAALTWATEHQPALAARIAAGVWRYWQMRGHLREGRAVLESVRERLPTDDPKVCFALFTALGGVAYWQRDLPAGEAAYAAAVRLAEESGDTTDLAEGLYNLSFAVWQQGRLEEATEIAERSQELFTGLGDGEGLARVLWLRGVLALLTRDVATAERLLAEAVGRHRAGADAFHLGWSLRMLGRTYLLQGRADDARERLDESLRLFAPAGDVSALVIHLADFAMLALLDGDVEREVRLVGAVRRLKQLTGTDIVDHPVNEIPALEETLVRLGPEADRLLAEGAAMTDDEAVRYALHELEPVGRHAGVVPPRAAADDASRPDLRDSLRS